MTNLNIYCILDVNAYLIECIVSDDEVRVRRAAHTVISQRYSVAAGTICAGATRCKLSEQCDTSFKGKSSEIARDKGVGCREREQSDIYCLFYLHSAARRRRRSREPGVTSLPNYRNFAKGHRSSSPHSLPLM